jgi:hypothetical protein
MPHLHLPSVLEHHRFKNLTDQRLQEIVKRPLRKLLSQGKAAPNARLQIIARKPHDFNRGMNGTPQQVTRHVKFGDVIHQHIPSIYHPDVVS